MPSPSRTDYKITMMDCLQGALYFARTVLRIIHLCTINLKKIISQLVFSPGFESFRALKFSIKGFKFSGPKTLKIGEF